LWEDPVATRFKARYAEGLEPLKAKLIPAMDNYQKHLDNEVNIIHEYTQNL
jgi:hypothetical protein